MINKILKEQLKNHNLLTKKVEFLRKKLLNSTYQLNGKYINDIIIIFRIEEIRSEGEDIVVKVKAGGRVPYYSEAEDNYPDYENYEVWDLKDYQDVFDQYFSQNNSSYRGLVIGETRNTLKPFEPYLDIDASKIQVEVEFAKMKDKKDLKEQETHFQIKEFPMMDMVTLLFKKHKDLLAIVFYLYDYNWNETKGARLYLGLSFDEHNRAPRDIPNYEKYFNYPIQTIYTWETLNISQWIQNLKKKGYYPYFCITRDGETFSNDLDTLLDYINRKR